jgi:Flp pilus assembly protein CpaB
MTSVRLLVPLALAVLAGGINFLVLRKSAATLDLVVVRDKVKAGTPLTEDMLGRLPLRADPAVFKSAVPYADRGVLLGRQLTRDLAEGEAVLFADVRSELDDVRPRLRAGESSLTLTVRAGRLAAGVRPGDEVMFLVGSPRGTSESSGKGARLLGPFRVLALADRAERGSSGTGPDEPRKLIVAVPFGADGRLDEKGQQLEEAARGNAPAIQAVEFFRPGVVQ